MRTLRASSCVLMLPFVVAGCAATSAVSPKMRTVASVGDRPLPVVTGEPGSAVVADRSVPPRTVRRDGRISGRVFDEDGEPIADARVRLAVGNAPGGKVISATTDRTGAFTLSGVRPGTEYTVIAEWEDEQGPLTGRSVVEAPDTNVRITLGGSEGGPAGARSAASAPRKRVSPISERDRSRKEKEPDEEDEDFLPALGSQPHLNEEDVPPAAEAETFTPTREDRTSSLPAESSTKVARWRRVDGEGTTAPAQRRASARDAAPAPRDPETQQGSAPFARPDADAPEDEGPNPLPPALEPGEQGSATRPEPTALGPALADLEKAPNPSAPVEDASALAATFPPADEADPFESAADARMPPSQQEPAARATATVAAAPAQDPFDEPPPTEKSQGPAPGALVAAPSDQSVFETEAELPAPADVSAAPPPDGPRRPTWKDLVSSAPAAPPAAPAELGSMPDGYPPDTPTPAPRPGRVAVATRAAPPASPPPSAPAGSFCDYDPKLRRIKEFRLPDLEGRPVRFQDLDADLVLLDFWGTWCQPCLRSVPHLVDLQKRIGPAKLKVVGIACEQGPVGERSKKVAQEVRRLGINYPVVMSGMDGPCPLQEALKIQAFPTLILVDRQGRVVWRDQGATPVTMARLDRFLAMSTKAEGSRRF